MYIETAVNALDGNAAVKTFRALGGKLLTDTLTNIQLADKTDETILCLFVPGGA